MDFIQVDVFTDEAYKGNPLAVFPDAAGLNRAQMQAIAREMNLSETTFVTSVEKEAYDVRIFTPIAELPFAGHPTIGTCWALRHLGLVGDDEIIQRSPAGETPVAPSDDLLWFERTGTVSPDLTDTQLDIRQRIAEAIGLEEGDIGFEAHEMGRNGRLEPASCEAGLEILAVPVHTPATLERAIPNIAGLGKLPGQGAYCFSPEGAGRLLARGFFPDVGIPEDAATGVAAAGLGLYLADRLGKIELRIAQGVQLGRPSRIELRAEAGKVAVGGSCALVLKGRLETLP